MYDYVLSKNVLHKKPRRHRLFTVFGLVYFTGYLSGFVNEMAILDILYQLQGRQHERSYEWANKFVLFQLGII